MSAQPCMCVMCVSVLILDGERAVMTGLRLKTKAASRHMHALSHTHTRMSEHQHIHYYDSTREMSAFYVNALETNETVAKKIEQDSFVSGQGKESESIYNNI